MSNRRLRILQLIIYIMQEEEENTDKLEKIVSSILNHVKQKIEDTSMIIFSTHTIVPLLYFIKVMDPEFGNFTFGLLSSTHSLFKRRLADSSVVKFRILFERVWLISM